MGLGVRVGVGVRVRVRLRVRFKVCDAVARLEALGGGLGRDGRDRAAALLPGNEREVAGVQAATVVPGHTGRGGAGVSSLAMGPPRWAPEARGHVCNG